MNIEFTIGRGFPDRNLFEVAWEECSELQIQPKIDWVDNSLEYLFNVDLYRFTVYDGDKIVGGLLLCDDLDLHVGRCLSVTFQYVLPEYRNKMLGFKLMKLALDLSLNLNYRVMAYTHRLGPWTYVTKYREIHGKETRLKH